MLIPELGVMGAVIATVTAYVARLALFLSSDDSAMITKQCYQVDGGLR